MPCKPALAHVVWYMYAEPNWQMCNQNFDKGADKFWLYLYYYKRVNSTRINSLISIMYLESYIYIHTVTVHCIVYRYAQCHFMKNTSQHIQGERSNRISQKNNKRWRDVTIIPWRPRGNSSLTFKFCCFNLMSRCCNCGICPVLWYLKKSNMC